MTANRKSIPRPRFNIQRVKELAATLTHERRGVFDQSIGVDENCFSARQIIRLVRGGAANDDLDHLSHCAVCVENISRVASLKLESETNFVAEAMKQVASGKSIQTTSSDAESSKRPVPAILGLKSRVFPVASPNAKDIALSCTLIPAFGRRLLEKIDKRSLQIDGAITATNAVIEGGIDVNVDGKDELLNVVFKDGKLSRRVRNGLARQQRVIDTIRVSGRFQGQKEGFVALATVEFVGDA